MTHSGRLPDTHSEAWVLLPFLANGRIAAEDREWVEAHLQTCTDCRRELAEQRPVADAMRESIPPFANGEQRAFSKLWTRIEAAENALPADDAPPRAQAGAGQRRTVRWLAAAVIIQSIGLALLGVTALNERGSGAEDYRTVTSTPTYDPDAAVRLVFAPQTTMATITEILGRHRLELVGGPSRGGVMTAAPIDRTDAASVESIVDALRENDHVRFAERLGD